MAKCSREQPPGDDVRGPDPLLAPLPDVRAADDAGAPPAVQGGQDGQADGEVNLQVIPHNMSLPHQ